MAVVMWTWREYVREIIYFFYSTSPAVHNLQVGVQDVVLDDVQMQGEFIRYEVLFSFIRGGT